MHFYEYKEFTIYPSPRLLLDSNTWTVNLSIRRGDKMKTINTAKSFSTKGEAAFHCINFGKKIIDGKTEDYTIADLL